MKRPHPSDVILGVLAAGGIFLLLLIIVGALV